MMTITGTNSKPTPGVPQRDGSRQGIPPVAPAYIPPLRQELTPGLSGRKTTVANTFWADNSTPQRTGNHAEALIDGKETFEAIAHSIKAAQKTIWITDWELTPDVLLVREAPPSSAGTQTGSVSWGAVVSDTTLRSKLEEIARRLGKPIKVTSGDRSYVPKGGSKTSLHLAKRAIDFHVVGLSDKIAFEEIMNSGVVTRGYELIWHGPHTATTGPHVHLGRYADGRGTAYKVEGDSLKARGHYRRVSPGSSGSSSDDNGAGGAGVKLSTLLREAAGRNVQVRVLLWDSLDTFEEGDRHDIAAENELEGIHSNIHVLRSSPGTKSSNHQKTVVIDAELDSAVAYLGGIDLTLGRYDKPAHELRPLGSPGLYDRYNPGVQQLEGADSLPRMPWHDVHMCLRGPSVTDVAANFVQRWNTLRQPWLARNEEAIDFNGHVPSVVGKHAVQIVRSICPDSGGARIERSILEAYEKSILSSQHFVYIENQYFISRCTENTNVDNRIGDAIANRILRAITEKADFHVFIIVPVHPEGDLSNHAVRGTLRKQLRSFRDLVARISQQLPGSETDWERYLSLLCLRSYATFDGGLVTEQIYVHTKLMIVDDSVAIIGSANINDRSLLGDWDSEISAIVADESWTTGNIGGKPRNVRPFAREARKKLMLEHFDLNIEDPLASLPEMKQIALANTQAYEGAFPQTPRNSYATFAEMMAAPRSGDAGVLKGVRGHVVRFPHMWLRNMEAPSSTESILDWQRVYSEEDRKNDRSVPSTA